MPGLVQPLSETSQPRIVLALRRGTEVFSRYWLAMAAISAVMAALLNWNAGAMRDLLPFYEDHRDVILSLGDAAQASREHSPTFPMWGYGFVMILLTNQLSQVSAQLIFALFSAWVFVAHLERN